MLLLVVEVAGEDEELTCVGVVEVTGIVVCVRVADVEVVPDFEGLRAT
jgi:hypothetical protein